MSADNGLLEVWGFVPQVQWKCEADLEENVRFGEMQVLSVSSISLGIFFRRFACKHVIFTVFGKLAFVFLGIMCWIMCRWAVKATETNMMRWNWEVPAVLCTLFISQRFNVTFFLRKMSLNFQRIQGSGSNRRSQSSGQSHYSNEHGFRRRHSKFLLEFIQHFWYLFF